MKKAGLSEKILKLGVVFPGIMLVVCFFLQSGIRRIPGVNLDECMSTDVVLPDGTSMHYDSNVFDSAPAGATLVFTIHMPEEARALTSPVLGMNIYNSLVTVKYGGEVIYQSEHDPSIPVGHRILRISLPQGMEQPVTVELLQQENYITSHFVENLVMPGEYAWLYPIASGFNQMNSIILLSFAIICVISLLLYSILSFQNSDMYRGIVLSLFCLSIAAWSMGFMGYTYLFTNDTIIAPYLEYVGLSAAPVFFCAYMGMGAQIPEHRKTSAFLTKIYALVFSAAFLIQLLSPAHDGFIRLLPLSQSGLFAGMLYYAAVIFRSKNIRDRYFRYGLMTVLFLAIIEMIRVVYTSHIASTDTLMYRLTSSSLTPYIVFVLGVSLSADYAAQGYATFRERMKVQQLKAMVYVDILTGLGNRSSFEDHEKPVLQNAKTYTIAFVDADGLKYINDTYGHEAGDRMLKHIGYAIQAGCAASGSRAYRNGGDEFLIVDTVKERVETAVAMMRRELQDSRMNISVSTGIAVHEEGAEETVTDVIKRADALMYQEKMHRHHTREDMGNS